MPIFRTAPTQDLNEAVTRLVKSSAGVTGLDRAHVDSLAASTAHNMSLADKARQEAEALRNAETLRADPAVATQYAADVSGLDTGTGTRLFRHLRGILEQPSPADIDDAAFVGREAQPFPTAAPNLQPGQRERFQDALATLQANRLATGKTNAEQMAKAGVDLQRGRLTEVAANTADVPTENRIIAAVSGRVREPFKVGPQGQVLNEETGDVNEGTKLATAAADLSGARTGTETGKQGALVALAKMRDAAAKLSAARAGAVERGEANKGGARVSPQQVERWASEVARKEWDALPAKERQGMNYQQHLDKVRARFNKTPAVDPVSELEDARTALSNGADAKAVAARFKQRTGLDLPDEPEAE